MADPLDRFRTALASAARAIARDPDIEVAFSVDGPGSIGKIARVPSPGPGLDPRLVAEARGGADSLALRLRHSDAALFNSRAPIDGDARAVFDALETARVEALGSRRFAGVSENL